MSEIDICQKYFQRNQQSDIFNQKDLNNLPEMTYSQKAHNPEIFNKTSCDFLAWKKVSKKDEELFEIRSHSMKKRIPKSRQVQKPKNFEEKLYSVDDIPKKTDVNLGQKETLLLGDYEGKEYKIKKEKTSEYNPNLYYKKKKPAQIKIEQIYGQRNKEKKPAILRMKTDDKQYNTLSNNPREMKYINIYGKKNLENANKKLESLTIDNSANNIYNPKFDPKQNRVNMLKSNIFNDNKIEKMNTETNFRIKKDEIKVITKEKKNKNYGKKAKYEKNAEKLPNKIDWRDSKINLLFNSERDKEVIKKDARQRKFQEIYGSKPIKPKERLENNFKINDRKLIEQEAKNLYTDLNASKIKKISENISQIQGNQFLNISSKYKEKRNKNEINKSFEIKSSRISEKEIEKAFADKGLHIYDIKEESTPIMGNIKDNKIIFKIRENKNDKEFENKIKNIQDDFKNNKKVALKEAAQKKKKNVDILPSSLKWTNANSHLYTKNRNVDKTLQEKTHSKPVDNINEEKMTKIFVNLKYKNQNKLS